VRFWGWVHIGATRLVPCLPRSAAATVEGRPRGEGPALPLSDLLIQRPRKAGSGARGERREGGGAPPMNGPSAFSVVQVVTVTTEQDKTYDVCISCFSKLPAQYKVASSFDYAPLRPLSPSHPHPPTYSQPYTVAHKSVYFHSCVRFVATRSSCRSPDRRVKHRASAVCTRRARSAVPRAGGSVGVGRRAHATFRAMLCEALIDVLPGVHPRVAARRCDGRVPGVRRGAVFAAHQTGRPRLRRLALLALPPHPSPPCRLSHLALPPGCHRQLFASPAGGLGARVVAANNLCPLTPSSLVEANHEYIVAVALGETGRSIHESLILLGFLRHFRATFRATTGCSNYPTCRVSLWLPAAATIATPCRRCGVAQLQFTFAPGQVPPSVPLSVCQRASHFTSQHPSYTRLHAPASHARLCTSAIHTRIAAENGTLHPKKSAGHTSRPSGWEGGGHCVHWVSLNEVISRTPQYTGCVRGCDALLKDLLCTLRSSNKAFYDGTSAPGPPPAAAAGRAGPPSRGGAFGRGRTPPPHGGPGRPGAGGSSHTTGGGGWRPRSSSSGSWTRPAPASASTRSAMMSSRHLCIMATMPVCNRWGNLPRPCTEQNERSVGSARLRPTHDACLVVLLVRRPRQDARREGGLGGQPTATNDLEIQMHDFCARKCWIADHTTAFKAKKPPQKDHKKNRSFPTMKVLTAQESSALVSRCPKDGRCSLCWG